jgi:hypothetical protein
MIEEAMKNQSSELLSWETGSGHTALDSREAIMLVKSRRSTLDANECRKVVRGVAGEDGKNLVQGRMIFKELNRICGLTFLQSFSERWSSHVMPHADSAKTRVPINFSGR